MQEKKVKNRKEDKLRREILRILKSQGKKIIDNCSPVEFGADILFLDKNYFGVEELCAIQLKVGDLNSRENKPSKNVKELLGQALIGITKERIIGNAKYKVSKFYIVIQGEIKPFARMYTDLVNYHFKQIHIIEKDDLEKYLTENKPKTNIISSGEKAL